MKEQASSIHNLPSVKLGWSPFINILSKTITTYMFLETLNHPQDKNQPWKTFKKVEWKWVKSVKVSRVSIDTQWAHNQDFEKSNFVRMLLTF